MEVLSLCPFRAASLVWQPRPSAYSLLVVCKATFELTPGVARLAEVQDYPNEEDNHWDDEPQKSLYSASDLVPSKPRADVLLVGHAFAPYGQEADSFVTRLLVGDVAKAIEVVSERAWTAEPHVRYGSRITKASLRYERAAGGPDTWNPVGVAVDAAPDAFGMAPLPALQPPGFMLVRREDRIPPVGYGPLSPSWPARRARLGRHAATFHASRWHLTPLPSDLDPAYFNAAPADQQTAEIHPDERIELVNLHPDIPHVVTALPGIKPRVFVERPARPPEEMLLRCDTLWIDTDRQIATVTWRGQVALAAREEAGRVLVAMEPPGRTLSFIDIERMLGRPTGPSQPGEESAIEWVEPDDSIVAERPLALMATATSVPPPALAAAAAAGDAGSTPLPASGSATTTPLLAGRFPSAPPGDASLDGEFPTGERPVRAGGPAREGIHMLWFDADCDAVCARLGLGIVEGSARAALLSPARAPSAPRSLSAALDAAIGPDGRFEPPPVALTGDLSLTLAPLDRLRALLTVAAVMDPADERVTTLRTRGERLVTGPSPEGAAWLSGRIADDLEAALAARAGAPDALAGVRRTLHAARAYTRALVLGGRQVRGLLRDAGGATLAVYISEAACVHLPLDERFRARVVGELYPRVDATDPAPFALRVAGIARIVTMR